MKRRKTTVRERYAYALALLIILVLLLPFIREWLQERRERQGLYTVVYVTDGDTIIIRKGEEEEDLRLIGIDAPEKDTEEGQLSRRYLNDLLLGKEITLQYGIEEKDKYGRSLVYVWLKEEMINEKILKDGYAEPLIISPNDAYRVTFEAAYHEAVQQKRGLWAEK